jgi:tetratricopeptide (TPR) repeat protein
LILSHRHADLGHALEGQGKYANAADSYRKASELRVALEKEKSRDPVLLGLIGRGRLEQSQALALCGDIPSAAEALDRSIAAWDTLRGIKPEDAAVLEFYPAALATRAGVLERLGRCEEAVADLRLLLEIRNKAAASITTPIRWNLARMLARSGELDASFREADALVSLDAKNGRAHFARAAITALSVEVLGRGNLQTEPGSSLRAKALAVEFLTRLERARELGYFQTADGIRNLQEDHDIDSMRSDAAVQNFLKSVCQEIDRGMPRGTDAFSAGF